MNRPVPATALLVEGRDSFRAACSEARDARQALDAVTTIQPKIIVAGFDSQTRNDCLSLCRAMKADPHTKRIPIVLTTPDPSADDVALATDPGVLVLTLMPSDGDKLTAATRRCQSLGVNERMRADTLLFWGGE